MISRRAYSPPRRMCGAHVPPASHAESHIEVRTSMQENFEVRTSILAFRLLLLEKTQSDPA